MELSSVQDAFTQPGQVATVYLEARPPSEDAAAQVLLRWHDLAEQLRSDGADDQALAAVDAALDRGAYGWQQGSGRVLVAAPQRLVLDEALDAAQGAGDEAYWAPLPRLGRYLREQAQVCRQLLILADQEGATVRQLVVSPQRGPAALEGEDVQQRSGKEVHKPRGGALANRRIQNRTEEVVLRQADEVVEHVRGVASRFQPAAVVLAGAVQAREAIRRELPAALDGMVTETEHGARAAGASQQPLDEALCEIADRLTRDESEQALERLRDQRPQGGATEGLTGTAAAAQTTAVGSLLLEHDCDLDGELWVGPEPEQLAVTRDALRDLGVSDPTRVDAESGLVRCCAATGATLDTVPAGSGLTDGVGALLRFDPGL